jgi:hypothetical protein
MDLPSDTVSYESGTVKGNPAIENGTTADVVVVNEGLSFMGEVTVPNSVPGQTSNAVRPSKWPIPQASSYVGASYALRTK